MEKNVKMKKLIFILLAMSSLFGCRDSFKDNAISMNTAERSDAELRQLIIQKGDSSAYYELSVQYLDYGYQDFLFYALTMANKYNYPQAYYDVYCCITEMYLPANLYLIDEYTATIAINYLIMAANMGHEHSQEIVREYGITKSATNNVAQIMRIYE